MAEIGFELFNNQLMQQLVGEADSNLRLIEKMLNVEILSFGNQITIKGAAGDVENAQAAIETQTFGGRERPDNTVQVQALRFQAVHLHMPDIASLIQFRIKCYGCIGLRITGILVEFQRYRFGMAAEHRKVHTLRIYRSPHRIWNTSISFQRRHI